MVRHETMDRLMDRQLKNLSVLFLCFILGACANFPKNRFVPFEDQIGQSNQIGVVLDSFGIDDIPGTKPGYDVEKNIAFSQAYQGVITELLEADGHKVKILHASRGLHVDPLLVESDVYVAEGGRATDQLFSKSVIIEEGNPWGDPALTEFFQAAIVESFLVNRKSSFLGDRIGAYPGGKSPNRLAAPKLAEPRRKILSNVPKVLSSSGADTILFVRVAGHEHDRNKGILVTAGGFLAGVIGGFNTPTAILKKWNSTSPMQAVAIDPKSGEVIWYEQFEGGRYSESHKVVKTLLRNFPVAR